MPRKKKTKNKKKNPTGDGEGKGDDKDDAAVVEEVFETLDLYDQMVDKDISKEQVQRLRELDQKHSNFHFPSMKKNKGPPPSSEESQEYLESVPIRLRATAPARRRVFLAEHSDAAPYWGMLEKTYADVNTYQYAWLGIITKEHKYVVQSIEVLRCLHIYIVALLTDPPHQNPRKALRVLRLSEQVIDVLEETMRDETGDQRWELEYTKYKQDFFSGVAFAALGHKDDAIEFWEMAASDEQGYRVQARMEYRDRNFHDEDIVTRLVDTPSILYMISEDLNIPRRHLDFTYEVEMHDKGNGETALADVDDDDFWGCLQCFRDDGWTPTTDPVEFCRECWATGPNLKLKKCSRCKDVSYCSQKCQLEHWKEHKEYCKPQQPSVSVPKTKVDAIFE